MHLWYDSHHMTQVTIREVRPTILMAHGLVGAVLSPTDNDVRVDVVLGLSASGPGCAGSRYWPDGTQCLPTSRTQGRCSN